MTSVVVAGAVANKPYNGGAAWTRLSFILGLRALGFDVHFVERIEPRHCVDAGGNVVPFRDSVNLAFFDRALEPFGLLDASALVLGNGESVHGSSWSDLMDLSRDAAFLLDISGHLASSELMPLFRRKVYVDTDPGYTQFWHAAGDRGPHLAGHDVFFTVGANIGTPRCSIPVDGVRWLAIRQPVVLDEWPVVASSREPGFSTVASWRGPYGRVDDRGRTFGLKVHEFRKVLGLPRATGMSFEVALDIHDGDAGDRDSLERHGWEIRDPRALAGDPSAFRTYVQTAWAEFSVAQGIYVTTQSGWFSDRTAKYLASGKPALVQDTGFGDDLPIGSGLVAFSTPEEAKSGARTILDDYERHAASARTIAEEYFDSTAVLGRMLEEIGAAP